MRNIRSDVLKVIQDFLDKKECFTSLDVYCMLGVRVNDEVYPIYEQVADAYRQGKMGHYLAEIVHLPLEHGSSANVWRYYLPVAEEKVFHISIDHSLFLTSEILGHFSLLDINLELNGSPRKIILTPSLRSIEDEAVFIKNTRDGIFIPESIIKEYELDLPDLTIKIYTNRIEIIP